MDEEMKKLAATIAMLQERAQAEDEAKARADAESKESAFREATRSKFGSLYNNDDDVEDYLIQSLKQRGADPETATIEAVRDELLPPLVQVVTKMAKALGGVITDVASQMSEKAAEVMEGPQEELATEPAGADGAPSTGVDLTAPDGGITLPDMGGGAGAGAPPDLSSVPAMDPGVVPSVDQSGLPDPTTGLPPASAGPGGMVSDDRYKNIRPTIVSDERFKSLELSDQRLKALEKMSAITELSDQDFKDIIFKDLKAPTPAPQTTVSDVTEKKVEEPTKTEQPATWSTQVGPGEMLSDFDQKVLEETLRGLRV